MIFPWKKTTDILTKRSGTLRVVTFNVHYARKPIKIAEAIQKNPRLSEADIFLLQEVEFHEKEIIPRAEAIASQLGFHYVYAPARDIPAIGSHGLAIVSRVKLEHTEIIKLPHYNILRPRTRIALLGTATIAGSKINICNVHLDTTLSFPRRIEQIGEVVQKLLKIPHGKIVLGGDFNTIPMKTVANKLPIFFENQKKRLHQYLSMQGFSTTTERIGYTLGRGLVRFQLDGIYTKNLNIIQSGVERSVKVSDHKPLWIDIKL
jgi:endonuclease/exonuclease/phosphatase family metal-dependent hydrolase